MSLPPPPPPLPAAGSPEQGTQAAIGNHARGTPSGQLTAPTGADLPHAKDPPRPQGADNRGRGAFAAMVTRHASGAAGASASTKAARNPTSAPISIPPPLLQTALDSLYSNPSVDPAANQASRPYVPVTLTEYPNYGWQQRTKVQATDYARQASQLLIDRKGELDVTHIGWMLHQLHTDMTLPFQYRCHIMLTLVKFQHGGELAATINSICEEKPLKDRAADIVRATLNLPPEQVLTKAEARQAVVMSLLGYLRQDEVGSCYATAPAVCLLGSYPEVVAKDMKDLLEARKLTFEDNGVLFDAPLNQHVFRAHPPLEVYAQDDGTFLQPQFDGTWAAHPVHVIPCMAAAMIALGIPEPGQQAAVVNAMVLMGKAGIAPNEGRVDCMQILAQLAQGERDNAQSMTDALRAFNGRQNVSLLQAWEYTLASFSIMKNASRMNDTVSSTLFTDTENGARPARQSPFDKIVVLVNEMAADPDFQHIDIPPIALKLREDIHALSQRRFTYQFDVNIKRLAATDGRSFYGGATLYEKIPAHDPSQWKRIDHAGAFQDAMVQLVKDASGSMQSRLDTDNSHADRDVRKATLGRISDELVKQVQDRAFIEYAVLKMNPDAAGKPLGDPAVFVTTPWQRGLSGNMAIAVAYGAELSYVKINGTKQDWTEETVPSNPLPYKFSEKANDAVDFAHFICEGLIRMASKLQAKAQLSPDGFKIPFANGPHASTLSPMTMRELWLEQSMTPQQWIDTYLKKPAEAWLHQDRNNPPLSIGIGYLAKEAGMAPERIKAMSDEVIQKLEKGSDTQENPVAPSYRYGDLYEKMKEFCRSQQDGDELLVKITTAMDKLSIPVRLIGDTNWSSENGLAVYMGMLHNPFTDKVEVQRMHEDCSNRTPFGEFNTWFGEHATAQMFTPLTDRARPAIDHQ